MEWVYFDTAALFFHGFTCLRTCHSTKLVLKSLLMIFISLISPHLPVAVNQTQVVPHYLCLVLNGTARFGCIYFCENHGNEVLKDVTFAAETWTLNVRKTRKVEAMGIKFMWSIDDPGSGNLITFSQFLFIALEGFIFTSKFGTQKPRIGLCRK
uniref:Uncharacterized protein n=1 Tax=Timema poppense TaxID=170557 RepID=A0A7R9D6Z6_TIMPO|nr:unnamed protein product [Timema poppensis]